jgi:hypothetical protein
LDAIHNNWELVGTESISDMDRQRQEIKNDFFKRRYEVTTTNKSKGIGFIKTVMKFI